MATRQRSHSTSYEDDPLVYEAAFGLETEVTDDDIEAYLDEQAAVDEEQTSKPGFLNVQTGAGIGLITVGVIYLLQQLGFFPLGYSLGVLVSFLPWLAGILIILTGFGVLSWSPTRRRRRARRKAQAKARARRAKREKTLGRERREQRVADTVEQMQKGATYVMRKTGRYLSRASERSAGRRKSATRKLARSRHNQKIAGVAAGIGEYFGIDPTLVRIAFVIGTVLGNGITIPLYLILSFVLPKAKSEEEITRVLRDHGLI